MKPVLQKSLFENKKMQSIVYFSDEGRQNHDGSMHCIAIKKNGPEYGSNVRLAAHVFIEGVQVSVQYME